MGIVGTILHGPGLQNSLEAQVVKWHLEGGEREGEGDVDEQGGGGGESRP